MQKRKRNYKQEYRRRKARGKQLGISLAAARGHARAGERTRPAEIATNPRGPEQSGLKMMKHGSSLKAAARANRVSEERLRRYLRENTDASRIGKVWKIIDLRRFHLPITLAVRLSRSGSRTRRRRGRRISQRRGPLPANRGCVSPEAFCRRRRPRHAGKFHPFETRENALYRLDTAGELSVPEIYKIQG